MALGLCLVWMGDSAKKNARKSLWGMLENRVLGYLKRVIWR